MVQLFLLVFALNSFVSVVLLEWRQPRLVWIVGGAVSGMLERELQHLRMELGTLKEAIQQLGVGLEMVEEVYCISGWSLG